MEDYEIVGYVQSGDSAVPIKRYKAAPAEGYVPTSCSKANEELELLEASVSHVADITRGSVEFARSFSARRKKKGF